MTRGGRTISQRVDYSHGMPENPMPHDEVERKFMSLAAVAVGPDRAGDILALANGVFDADSVAPLNALLTASPIAEVAQA